MKQKTAAAATNASAQSHTSKPKYLFYKLGSNAGSEKHGQDNRIKKIFNLGHAAVPVF